MTVKVNSEKLRELVDEDVEVEQIATDAPPDRVLLKLIARREAA